MTKFTCETVVKVDGQFLDMEDVVNALNEQEETITSLSDKIGRYQAAPEVNDNQVEQALVITGLKRRVNELETELEVPAPAPIDEDKEKELNDIIEQKNARITSLAKQRSVVRIMATRIGNQCDVVKMVELMKHILKGTTPANMAVLEKAMVEAGDMK